MIIYYRPTPRTNPPPSSRGNQSARWGERTRLRALRVAFGNVPSEASPLRCMSSASSRRLVFTSPMISPLAQLWHCCCVNGGLVPHICMHRCRLRTKTVEVHLNIHQHLPIRQCIYIQLDEMIKRISIPLVRLRFAYANHTYSDFFKFRHNT